MGAPTDFPEQVCNAAQGWASLFPAPCLGAPLRWADGGKSSPLNIFISKNLHLLIRHRRHQTASTSQDGGRALRYPLQKKCPSRRAQEHAEEGPAWSWEGCPRCPRGAGGTRARRGPPDAPAAAVPLPKAEPAKPVIWQQFAYWWCLLPFSLIALQEGKVTGKRRTPPSKMAKRLLRARGLWWKSKAW